MDTSGIRGFYASRLPHLFSDSDYRKKLLSYKNLFQVARDPSGTTERQTFENILMTYVGEAEHALSFLVEAGLHKQSNLLEIGGGTGLLYGYLTALGFSISSSEPSGQEYEGYYETALKLFEILAIDPSRWYPFPAAEVARIRETFDIVFSYNVLEHVRDLGTSFKAIKSVLKPEGITIHHTVNYGIPYEPHLGIFLVPFFPKLTTLLRPGLKSSPVWSGLNFVTPRSLRSVCRSCGLKVRFEKEILWEAVERLDRDPLFATRQRRLFRLFRWARRMPLASILRRLPPSLCTPIRFKAWSNGTDMPPKCGPATS